MTAMHADGAAAVQPQQEAVSREDSDLVAWWTFDEGEGYTVKDVTDHGHDLHILQPPRWEVCCRAWHVSQLRQDLRTAERALSGTRFQMRLRANCLQASFLTPTCPGQQQQQLLLCTSARSFSFTEQCKLHHSRQLLKRHVLVGIVQQGDLWQWHCGGPGGV